MIIVSDAWVHLSGSFIPDYGEVYYAMAVPFYCKYSEEGERKITLQ